MPIFLLNILGDIAGFIDESIFGPIAEGLSDGIFALYTASNVGAMFVLKLNDINHVMYSGVIGRSSLSHIVFSGLAAVGIGLSLLYWLFGIIDKLTKDRLNPYVLLRSFIELTIAIVFVYLSYDIIATIANISCLDLGNGQTLSTLISNNIDTSSLALGAQDDVVKIFTFGSTMDGLAGIIPGILGVLLVSVYFLISMIVYAFLATVVIGRVIQTALYIAMAPLAVANVYNRGSILESSAMSYIKKIAALSLQGPIIAFIVLGGSAIEVKCNSVFMGGDVAFGLAPAQDAAGTLLGLVLLLATKFVMVSMATKSSQFANDIIS